MSASESKDPTKMEFLERLAADERLSATDFRVAFAIVNRYNLGGAGAFPSFARIASDTRLHRVTVVRSVNRLRALGVIIRTIRPNKTNLYDLDWSLVARALPVAEELVAEELVAEELVAEELVAEELVAGALPAAEELVAGALPASSGRATAVVARALPKPHTNPQRGDVPPFC
jgi:hypothetical protein